MIERDGEVVHLVAQRLLDYSALLGPLDSAFARFPLRWRHDEPSRDSRPDRQPPRAAAGPRICPFLDAAFPPPGALCAAAEATPTEERIWDVWMHHPHRAAARVLDLATRDIAARRYDIAETRLTLLLRSAPAFRRGLAQARRRSTTCSGATRNACSDIGRTLELEPRHFARHAAFRRNPARRRRAAARRASPSHARAPMHPHLPRAREALADKA